MLRRRDGNEVAHRINTAHPARLEDGGKSVNPGIGAQPAAIEPYVAYSRLAHAPKPAGLQAPVPPAVFAALPPVGTGARAAGNSRLIRAR